MAAELDNTSSNTNSNNPTGVYKNLRLMHACTSIIGHTVHLQTKDGTVWEGIFHAYSPEFTICLKLALSIDPKLNSKDSLYAALTSGSQAKEQAFFDLKDIVRISAIDVDLNYATKDLAKLATDADISGYDASKSNSANQGEQKQLESWQDDDGDNVTTESLFSLDDAAAVTGANKNDSRNSSRGWDAQDMFRYNERVHKVTTTYDEKLTDYTLPLPKHSTKEWRKKQERAAAIAKEIEGNTKSQNRLAKEDDDGDDEEEKFSAVLRPIPNQPASAAAAAATATTTTTTNNSNSKNTAPTSTTAPATAAAAVAGNRPSLAATQKQQNVESSSPDTSGPKTQLSQQAPHQPQQQQQHQYHHHHQQQQHNQHQHHQLQQQHQHHHNQHQQHYNQQHHNQHHHQQQQHHHQASNENSIRQSSPATNQPHMNKPVQAKVFMNKQNGNFKNRSHIDRTNSLKNFGKQLIIGTSPRQPQINQNQLQNSPNSNLQQQTQQQNHQQSLNKQPQQSHPQQHTYQQQHHPHPQQQSSTSNAQQSHHHPIQQQALPTPAPSQQLVSSTTSTTTNTTPTQVPPSSQTVDVNITTTGSPSTASTINASTVSERSDTSSNLGSTSTTTSTQPAKEQQSEIARKSKLNPHAKEFVYKPRSPAANQSGGAHANGANQTPGSVSTGGPPVIDPNNSSPMSQQHAQPYYPQVSIFPHGLSAHQQQHHAAQFMPSPHFPQNQIHYMGPVPPPFAQQMQPARFYRGNFQNYHHRGEHHNNVRADYSQSPMMAPAPNSSGQPFPTQPPTGAPLPMNAYQASPQQQVIYGGPPQSMYPMVQAGFPQHMTHMMPNPPPYDGSTVYMPSQNYIVNPQ